MRSERDLKYSSYLDLVLSQTMGCWTHISLICLCLSTSLQTPTVYQHPSVSFVITYEDQLLQIFLYTFCLFPHFTRRRRQEANMTECVCVAAHVMLPLCRSFSVFKRLFGTGMPTERNFCRIVIRDGWSLEKHPCMTKSHGSGSLLSKRHVFAHWKLPRDYIFIQLLFLIKKKRLRILLMTYEWLPGAFTSLRNDPT